MPTKMGAAKKWTKGKVCELRNTVDKLADKTTKTKAFEVIAKDLGVAKATVMSLYYKTKKKAKDVVSKKDSPHIAKTVAVKQTGDYLMKTEVTWEKAGEHRDSDMQALTESKREIEVAKAMLKRAKLKYLAILKHLEKEAEM